MTAFKLNLRDVLVREIGGTETQIPATIDVDDLLEFSDIHNAAIDIDELLRNNRVIGVIWHVDDVKSRRLDLSEDQCWQVLQAVKKGHDCEHGITWETIEAAAESLFGSVSQHRIGRCELALMDYGSNGDLRECLVDFLTNAMHWCSAKRHDFGAALRTAEGHFATETDE